MAVYRVSEYFRTVHNMSLSTGSIVNFVVATRPQLAQVQLLLNGVQPASLKQGDLYRLSCSNPRWNAGQKRNNCRGIFDNQLTQPPYGTMLETHTCCGGNQRGLCQYSNKPDSAMETAELATTKSNSGKCFHQPDASLMNLPAHWRV